MVSSVRALGFVSLALVACGGEVLGGARVAEVPDAHARATPAEIAADPCLHGARDACARRCLDRQDAPSCNTVGVMLEFDADRADPAEASRYYRLACGGAYAPGCNNLGWLYMLGRGVRRDPPLSMALFARAYDAHRTACLRGEVEGCVLAGDLAREGRAGDATPADALALFARGCGLGHAPACRRMAD
ncbi:MAG: sel1 repeat family protein [Polyangiaceae bacterium]|nr:sel1 repeat family protein [Polyangiaceae bacterium]